MGSSHAVWPRTPKLSDHLSASPCRRRAVSSLPSILTGVTSQTAAVQEEIFGPVLTVQTFEEEEEALELASHRSMGWPPVSIPPIWGGRCGHSGLLRLGPYG